VRKVWWAYMFSDSTIGMRVMAVVDASAFACAALQHYCAFYHGRRAAATASTI